tara:strand:+ start:604 stop:1287 length:684 start_codon:yes stop_codon:yes gene_type:complete
MTQKQLIELINQHHPSAGETEVRLALNRAKDDFCSKTEIVVDSWVQDSVAGQRYYTLDDRILRIKEVQINDVSIPRLIGKPIINDDEYDGATGLSAGSSSSNDRSWYIDKNRIGVVEKISGVMTRDGKQSDYQSISEVKEIRVIAVSRDSDFTTDLTETGNIPVQFREALVFKTIGDLMLRQGSAQFNPQLSQLFDAKYTSVVKEAKKYARDGKIHSGSAIIKPQDF